MISYEAVDDDEGKATRIIRLIEPKQVISIISDIDDTIKISKVLDKVRLFANIFIFSSNPYQVCVIIIYLNPRIYKYKSFPD